jgi:peptidoglycan/LPS O-acetylase OafA/YrhL
LQSKNASYLAKVDHLRALAAVTVMLFHTKLSTLQAPSQDAIHLVLIDQGHVGVPLFMVISGFILSHITTQKKIIVKRFYANRILRIYPLLVTIAALSAFTPPSPNSTSAALVFFVLLLPISGAYPVYSSPLWSVIVELQFYILFPLIRAMLDRYKWRAYSLMLMFVILIRMLIWLSTGKVHYLAFFTLFGGLDAFLFGAIARDVYALYRDQSFPWWTAVATMIAVVIVLSTVFKMRLFFHVDYQAATPQGLYVQSVSPMWIIWPTIQGALFAAVLVSYLLSKVTMFGSRQLAWIGTISYSFYAWHALVISALASRFEAFLTPYLIGLLIILPVSLVVAAVSYYVVEWPFLQMRVRYVGEPIESTFVIHNTDRWDERSVSVHHSLE